MTITVNDLLTLNAYVQDVEIIDYETEEHIAYGESIGDYSAFSKDILNAPVMGYYAVADDDCASIVILIEQN